MPLFFSSCPLQKGIVTFEKGIFSQHLSSVCKKLIMNYICTDSVSWFAILLNFMQLWQIHLSCTFHSHLHSSLVPPLSKNCPKRQPMLRVSGQTHKSHFNSVVLQTHCNPYTPSSPSIKSQGGFGMTISWEAHLRRLCPITQPSHFTDCEHPFPR